MVQTVVFPEVFDIVPGRVRHPIPISFWRSLEISFEHTKDPLKYPLGQNGELYPIPMLKRKWDCLFRTNTNIRSRKNAKYLTPNIPCLAKYLDNLVQIRAHLSKKKLHFCCSLGKIPNIRCFGRITNTCRLEVYVSDYGLFPISTVQGVPSALL